MLWAENLGHAFGAVQALDGISFSLTPGQTLAIFGPNGAGKTTLLKVLAGLLHPSRGRAHIEGGRHAVGWIGHQSQLYGHLSVIENLRFWASLYDLAPRSEEFARRAGDLLRRLGLEELEHRLVRVLSRGQLQRAAIARALIHDPRVLLLDEPFTGLDRVAAGELRRLLAEEAAEGRVTVLVTHNVEEGVELATEIAFMRGGRFVQLAARGGRDAAQIAAEYREAVPGA